MKDEISIKRVLLLHPKIREDIANFIDDAEKGFGITLRVIQGLRTFAEQQAIYNQPHDGKDNDGDGKIDEADERVSNANAGQSYHNYGLAIDVAELKDGKINWQFNYKSLLPYALKYKLDWGGNFSTIKDQPHFENRYGFNWRQLLAKYNAKDFILGTTYVNI